MYELGMQNVLQEEGEGEEEEEEEMLSKKERQIHFLSTWEVGWCSLDQ